MKRLAILLLAGLIMVSCSTQLLSQNRKKVQKQVTANVVEKVMPVIGVSSKAESGVASANSTYINAVKKAGGVPLVIPITHDSLQIEAVLNAVDAVIMTGGEDYDPQIFGEQPVRELGEIVPDRDKFDLMLIRMAVRKGLPLLGICRGEQGLNVAFGGTLYQDIPSQKEDSYVKHRQNAPGSYGTHSIKIDPDSNLSKMLDGVTETTVNSFHHQAVKDLAPGFRVVAVSADGVVEAIEMKDNNKVWGLQFHPEIPTSHGSKKFLGVFKHLVELAAQQREERR